MSSGLSRRAKRRAILVVGLSLGVAGLAVALAYSNGRKREATEALARGRAYLQKGQSRRAIQAVSRIGKGSPFEGQALTIRGLALAALGEIGPARRVLERALRVRPDPMAAKMLAAIYLGAYETERGLQTLELAARLDPQDFRPWYAMGEGVYLRLRRYDEAAGAFRQALTRAPAHLGSRIGLIEALAEAHRPEEAESRLQAVLHDQPDDPKVLVLAARLALEAGRSQEAAQFVDRSLALDPDHRAALLLRARLRFGAGQSEQALADAERASRLDPTDVAALQLLGTIQVARGLKEQAAQTVARGRDIQRRTGRMEELLLEIQRRPDEPGPRCRLGQLAREAGLESLALQSYQAALALDPNWAPARQGLLELGVPRAQIPPLAAAQLVGAPTRGLQRHEP